MFQRAALIDPEYFVLLPRLYALPRHVRLCSEHNRSVFVREGEYLLNEGWAAPFARAALVGCRDKAIISVWSAMKMHNAE